jgi:uncharacterized membrane protein
MSQNTGNTSTGLQQNIAGLLCYVLGWITGIIFLIIEKDDKFVRFHAWQSVIVFGLLTVLGIIFNWVWFLGYIVWAISVIAWIVLMYKAYKGEKYKVPIAGDIAEKQS